MKDYSKEESVEIINRINKMQRIVFKYKKENDREPTDKEIATLLNEPFERILEIKTILKELEEQDKAFELEYKTNPHTKKDIKKAREIRKRKKAIKDIQKYMKDE